MSSKTLSLVAIVLVLSVCQLQAGVVSVRWDGGPAGNWDDASCWYPRLVPENAIWDTYSVSIDSGDFKAQVGVGQRHVIDRLVCQGDVTLYGPWYPVNLTLVEGLVNQGKLYTSQIDYTGDVRNAAGATLHMAEFFSVHGNLYNEPEGIIEVVDQEMSIVDANAVNRGLIRTYRNGGLRDAIEFRNYGKIELVGGGMSGGNFNNSATGVIEGWGSVRSEKLTMNEGVILASGGHLAMLSDGSTVNAGTLGNRPLAALAVWNRNSDEVNNLGTIEVNAGGGVAFHSDLINEPNGVVKLLGGTLAVTTMTQKAGATFQGFGGITGNVVLEPNAVVELTGPTNIVGDVIVGEGATLDISDGTALVTGLTTCNGGTIRTRNGTIITQGGMSGDTCQREVLDPAGP
jgi:hypothetical protein